VGKPVRGKKASQIAREQGVGSSRVRQWAQWNGCPHETDRNGDVDYYYFDEEWEKRFIARKENSNIGRPRIVRPPKIPGKVGRPRKEKSDNTEPKRPVGRPRKIADAIFNTFITMDLSDGKTKGLLDYEKGVYLC